VITSMKRVGELHAVSVSSECYWMDSGGRSIKIVCFVFVQTLHPYLNCTLT
jgi:hypothetical protein